jgi:hypothetical protein
MGESLAVLHHPGAGLSAGAHDESALENPCNGRQKQVAEEHAEPHQAQHRMGAPVLRDEAARLIPIMDGASTA